MCHVINVHITILFFLVSYYRSYIPENGLNIQICCILIFSLCHIDMFIKKYAKTIF